MKTVLKKIMRGLVITLIPALFSACADNDKPGDVDLSQAIPLLAEAVAHQPDKSIEGPIEPNDLFTNPPGTWVDFAALGTIDPVGTTLPADFDGDGILNENETTTNIWVADYPLVEANIATPVTMKIEVLYTNTKTVKDIVSEISSSDYELNSQYGTDSAHRNEINTRTVQFQDSYSTNKESNGSWNLETSFEVGYKLNTPFGGGGGNISTSLAAGSSWGSASGYSETKTKFANIPHINNHNSDSWTKKSDSASAKARNYRDERNSLDETTTEIKSDAGYVRAALYIKNLSVNMPVRLSDILCSLMFETPTGELVPVQSFRLRNADYSLFQVDIYGGDEFGPYVVELANLNTVEIENAISLGYTPKIFIVDYQMEHVPDSNYRSVLLNYSGDNLKIVEENAKGRTALFKILGPGFRRLYRIAAFTTNAPDPDPCATNQGTSATPGVTLEEALKRLSCSGLNVEFEDYVVDLTDIAPELGENRIHLRTIKALGGIPTRLPCEVETHTGSDLVGRSACVQKPVSTWSQAEIDSAGAWVIIANGKYYSHTKYIKDGTDTRIFNSPTPADPAIPMVEGAQSIAWAGDSFHIAYLSVKDLLNLRNNYGLNPMETGEPVAINTRWNLDELGVTPFDPDMKSTFLGQAGFGETVLLRFKLRSSTYLEPSFGEPYLNGSNAQYWDFSYNQRTTTDRFNLDDVVDFEISMGFGGERTDWQHIRRDLSADTNKIGSCGTSQDYVNQEFIVCLQLPTTHPFVEPALSLINLYIRPAFNTAYRETAWPHHFSDVKTFQGLLNNKYDAGETVIAVNSGIGKLLVGHQLYLEDAGGAYSVSAVTETDGIYEVTLGSALATSVKKSTGVYVDAQLLSPQTFYYKVGHTGFETDWNIDTIGDPYVTPSLFDQWRDPMKTTLLTTNGSYTCAAIDFHPNCLGYNNPDYAALNWMGNYNYGVPYWNTWSASRSVTDFYSENQTFQILSSGKYAFFKGTLVGRPALQTSASTALDFPRTASSPQSNLAITVWQAYTGSSWEIRGRITDMDTQTNQGTADFTVGTVTTGALTTMASQVAVSGDYALVVWQSYNGTDYDIRGRVVQLSTAVMQPDFLVSTVSSGDQIGPQVALVRDRVVIVWESIEGADNNIRSAVVHYLSTGTTTLSGNTLIAFSVGPINFIRLAGAAHTVPNEDRAIIVWQAHNGTDYDIRGTILRTHYNSIQYGNFLINSITADNQKNPVVTASGMEAFVAWESSNAGGISVAGRFVNMSSGTIHGAGELTVNTLSGNARWPVVTAGGYDRGFVAWEADGNSIHGRFIDFSTQALVGISELGVASSTVSAPSGRAMDAMAFAGGDRGVLVYESYSSGNLYDIHLYMMDFKTASLLAYTFTPASSLSTGDERFPALTLGNGRGMIVYNDDNTGVYNQYLDENYVFPLLNGANNFFIAPLIERTFDVTAQIR